MVLAACGSGESADLRDTVPNTPGIDGDADAGDGGSVPDEGGGGSAPEPAPDLGRIESKPVPQVGKTDLVSELYRVNVMDYLSADSALTLESRRYVVVLDGGWE